MGNNTVCSVMGLPISAQFFIFAMGFALASLLWLSAECFWRLRK